MCVCMFSHLIFIASWFGFLRIDAALYANSFIFYFFFFVGQRQKCVYCELRFACTFELNEWVGSTSNEHKVHIAVAKEWLINKSYMFRLLLDCFFFFFLFQAMFVKKVRVNPLKTNGDAAFRNVCSQCMILAFGFVYWISNGISLPWHTHTHTDTQKGEKNTANPCK